MTAARLAAVPTIPGEIEQLLTDFATVLQRDDERPSTDSIGALTVDTYCRSISLYIEGYRAFLHWAMWLGLAFTRVHRPGGFTFAARGPVKTKPGRPHLQIHLTCTHDQNGVPL